MEIFDRTVSLEEFEFPLRLSFSFEHWMSIENVQFISFARQKACQNFQSKHIRIELQQDKQVSSQFAELPAAP